MLAKGKSCFCDAENLGGSGTLLLRCPPEQELAGCPPDLRATSSRARVNVPGKSFDQVYGMYSMLVCFQWQNE